MSSVKFSHGWCWVKKQVTRSNLFIKRLVYTLTATVIAQYSSNLVRMFVLMERFDHGWDRVKKVGHPQKNLVYTLGVQFWPNLLQTIRFNHGRDGVNKQLLLVKEQKNLVNTIGILFLALSFSYSVRITLLVISIGQF